jgi:hypothetical protein
MSNEIPYQIAGQVEALQQERANCVAYGNDTRVASIDRQLAEYGVKADAAEKRAASKTDKTDAPADRRAKEADQTRSAAVADDSPKGNASRDDWVLYAIGKGATDEEVATVEDGGPSRDELRTKYGATPEGE